jgi:hypothetical protein
MAISAEQILAIDFSDTTDTYIARHIEGEQPLSIVPKKLNYIFEPNKITLSYSRLQTLRTCPRMFLCRELQGQGQYEPTLDTAYGHSFAAAIQELFRSGSLARAFLAALEAWDYAYFTDPWGKKHTKSYWYCIMSIRQWYNTTWPQYSERYKIATFNGKPAIELFVYVAVGTGYNYQIHIDLILEDIESGAVVVAEIKTSGMTQQRANWENSLQTLGYFTAAKAIAIQEGKTIHPDILYIVQQVGKIGDADEGNGFFNFEFAKPPTAVSDFMMDLASQTAILEIFIENGFFPKHGHNCVQYGKPCKYFGTCDSLPNLPTNSSAGQHYINSDLTSADYVLTFDSIVELITGADNVAL